MNDYKILENLGYTVKETSWSGNEKQVDIIMNICMKNEKIMFITKDRKLIKVLSKLPKCDLILFNRQNIIQMIFPEILMKRISRKCSEKKNVVFVIKHKRSRATSGPKMNVILLYVLLV